MITLIAAVASNGAIGRNGEIPWHVEGELAFFRRETLGGAVVMGRRTWGSLKGRALPDRLNIVVSAQDLKLPREVKLVRGVSGAVYAAQRAGYSRIYGIGGRGIYDEMMPLAERMVITRVPMAIPDADAFFPPIKEEHWQSRHIAGAGASFRPACEVVEFMRLP